MKEIVWYSPEIKPKDNQKIRFSVKDNDLILEGLYIESENMFFVGFENESDEFYFSWQIEKWCVLEEPKVQNKKSAVEWFEKEESILRIQLENYEITRGEYAVKHIRLFDQAKEMFKEQVKNSYLDGFVERQFSIECKPEQYYEQKFKSE